MEPIQIETKIHKPLKQVWEFYNAPEHITQWNFADSSWHCPTAENDLRVGGKLKSRMEAKDKSFGFDFEGIYDEVLPYKSIKYHLGDGRNVSVIFTEIDPEATQINIVFDPENQNPIEMQKTGWGMILNNFKNYSENQ